MQAGELEGGFAEAGERKDGLEVYEERGDNGAQVRGESFWGVELWASVREEMGLEKSCGFVLAGKT